MIATVVLRIRSEELARGEIIGWAESARTGDRYVVRSAWELVEVLRVLTADQHTGGGRA